MSDFFKTNKPAQLAALEIPENQIKDAVRYAEEFLQTLYHRAAKNPALQVGFPERPGWYYFEFNEVFGCVELQEFDLYIGDKPKEKRLMPNLPNYQSSTVVMKVEEILAVYYDTGKMPENILFSPILIEQDK